VDLADHGGRTIARRFRVQRYAAVETEDFLAIADAYAAMPVGRTLEPIYRLLLFEMQYGGGGRHIVNGNSVMARQSFTTVQPLFFKNLPQLLCNRPRIAN
jgi:hypothetical protein